MLNLLIIILVCIMILIGVSIFYKKYEGYNREKIDFVTIVYDNETELNLLKLQAHSFKFIDRSLLNDIIIVYNDKNPSNFKKTFKRNILPFYPRNFQHKVKIITLEDLNIKLESSWNSQQIVKLEISKLIQSEYYVMLDAKNHFIRKVNYRTFFKNGKPAIFLNNPGKMIRYYYNCLDYFEAQDPFNYKKTGKGNEILLTTTPYLFHTEDVKDLLKFIENKEKTPFPIFFQQNRNLTEFYLYSTYLIYTNKIKNCWMCPSICKILYGEINRAEVEGRINQCLLNTNIKCFGLHRKFVKDVSEAQAEEINTEWNENDNTYKKNILIFYSNFYDKETIDFIGNEIFN